MGRSHGYGKSTINQTILWVEHRLSAREEFQLADIKERFKPEEANKIKILLVDVEEQPIERPTENQKDSYSGKKKNTRQNTR